MTCDVVQGDVTSVCIDVVEDNVTFCPYFILP